MKLRRYGCCLLMPLLLAAALPAQAGQGWRDGGFQVQQHPHPPQGDRQFQQAPRRQDAQPNPQGPQGPQRMSPDERRQLRQDLRDAGRDVYPQRRDGRR
jgi:uncharacterized membrane protein